jgi:dipeptidyl-peptidase-4
MTRSYSTLLLRATAVVACGLLTAFSSWAQEKTAWSNKEIWASGNLRAKGIYGITSMADGQHYTSLERLGNGSAVVRFAYLTGKPVDTLVTSQQVFKDPNRTIDSYSFSSDEGLMLIATDEEAIYRHSTKATYYVYDRAAQRGQQLTPKSGRKQRLASFSPNADRVAFVRDNNIFLIDLKTGAETQVTPDGVPNGYIYGATDWVYEEEFGEDNAMHWSPDGKWLAFLRFDEVRVPEFSMQTYGELYPEFVNFKYPKAGGRNSEVSVQVYSVESGATLQVTQEKTEYLPRIAWTAEPGVLLVMAMNRHQNDLSFRLARLGEARGGKVEAVTRWQEKAETYIDITDNLTFLDAQRFITTSERDGFNHLYLFGWDGSVQQLTKGNWDVESVYGWDAARGEVYFSGSMEGATQQHLARVNLKGNLEVLDRTPGTHGAAFSRTFDYCIHDHSTASTPPVYTLRDRKWKTVRVLEDNAALKSTLAEYTLSAPRFFQFKNDAGIDLNAYVIEPHGFDPSKKYPVYMAIYGGPGVNTVKDAWGASTLYFHQLLAQEGYYVVSCDPRGTPRRGREFEHSTYLALGKLETEDFIDFAQHLATWKSVDAGRIGIQGWSYGGFMSLLCMTRGADFFKAGISIAPVTHWKYYDTVYTERFLRTPKENPSGYDDNSPINHADKLRGPLLLVHGTSDDNVHFQNAVDMADALITAGKQFDFFAYPNRNHGIYGGNTRLHLYEMMLGFVKENI